MQKIHEIPSPSFSEKFKRQITDDMNAKNGFGWEPVRRKWFIIVFIFRKIVILALVVGFIPLLSTCKWNLGYLIKLIIYEEVFVEIAETKSSETSKIHVNVVSRFENLATLTLGKRRAILTGTFTVYNTEEIDNKVSSIVVQLFWTLMVKWLNQKVLKNKKCNY